MKPKLKHIGWIIVRPDGREWGEVLKRKDAIFMLGIQGTNKYTWKQLYYKGWCCKKVWREE